MAADPGNYPGVDLSRVPFFGKKRQLYFFSFRRFSGVWSLGSSRFVLKWVGSLGFLWFCKVLTSGLEVRVFLWFCRVLTSAKMFNLLPCPNSIRYSWFWSGPQRQTRGIRASDLQAPSPNCLVVHPLDPPKIPKSKIQKSKIPKIQNPKIQNPKSPKSKTPQKPKSKIPKIQNPPNPKSHNPKSPQSKIQNPQNPKSKLFWPDFGDFGFRILHH